MTISKKQKKLENAISFFAWASGLITSLTVGFAVWSGSIQVPEILPGTIFSDALGWIIALLAITTIVLSFFRK